MDYIKDLVTGNTNQEHVHQKFVKYSKGTFAGPAITVKKAGETLKIVGSYDYSDTIAGVFMKALQGPLSISGTVLSRSEMKTDLAVKSKKKLGLYITEVKGEKNAKDLYSFYSSGKDATFLVDMESGKCKLKSKKKPPKPGSARDGEFFSATMPASALGFLMSDVCFDCDAKDFKELRIEHEFRIDEIVIPDQYKSDAAKARLTAKRKGTLKRKVDADGSVKESTKDLLV
jgi:hypothetical protein